jgi:pyruvate,water dikinase
MRSDEKVRNEMGFLNVKLMIPFAEPWKERRICRDGRNKLVQGENGLEVYVMIEIPVM